MAFKCFISVKGFDGSPEKMRDRYTLAGIADEVMIPMGFDWYWHQNGITIEIFSRDKLKSIAKKIKSVCETYNIQVEIKYRYKD